MYRCFFSCMCLFQTVVQWLHPRLLEASPKGTVVDCTRENAVIQRGSRTCLDFCSTNRNLVSTRWVCMPILWYRSKGQGQPAWGDFLQVWSPYAVHAEHGGSWNFYIKYIARFHSSDRPFLIFTFLFLVGEPPKRLALARNLVFASWHGLPHSWIDTN